MFKPKKLLLLSLSLSLSFLLLSLPAFLFAEESITITTYYPSPYGVYNELQLFPHNPAVTACDDAHKGTLFYKSTDDQVYVCKGTTLGWKPVSAGAPSGFCVFSDTQTSCPTGWTRRTQFDGRTIRGFATPGGTGGADTHNHGSFTDGDSVGTSPASVGATDAASSWPPYMNVIICCKD